MRKSLVVCSLAVSVVSAASVPVAGAAPAAPGAGSGSAQCSIEYNADQVPVLAAGVLGDDLFFYNGSRADALALWEKKQTELRAGIGENGWGTLTQIDDAKLWEPGVTPHLKRAGRRRSEALLTQSDRHRRQSVQPLRGCLPCQRRLVHRAALRGLRQGCE